ncbi:MAG: hypothetical protein FJZ58_05460 [Chlamydiae bacterium]|nr:hypothetical protein [Chlamydiota bacterium]
MTKQLLTILKQELNTLEDASNILTRSYEICKQIGQKENYPLEELDHLEALTSRFARLSDLLMQKIFRIVDELDLETPGTVRDRLNRAEKKRLISSADSFIKIRILRNDIAHEYMPQALWQIYKQVMEWTPCLLDAVGEVKQYLYEKHLFKPQ